MKHIITVIITLLLLSGCSNTNSREQHIKENQIKPDEVAGYIENFKRQFQRLSFEFDGKKYPIQFEDIDFENELLFISFESGILLVGFDLEHMEPLPTLAILLGDTSDIENFNPTKELEGIDIEMTLDNDNVIYQGMMADTKNRQYSVRLVLNESIVEAGASQINIEGKTATIFGTLGTQTYIQIQQMLNEHDIDTLVLQSVLGSVNDAINVHTARLVRDAGLTTVMRKDGEAYSGGVDLFAAGKERIYEDGGKLGVHSWCCIDGMDAGELKKSDPAHNDLLAYYREMMGAEKGSEFYFFTIYAAAADDIHIMSKAEI